VHAFPGHIACDSASNSEIVVPIVSPVTKEVVGVFDIDSPTVNGLDEEDAAGLEAIARVLANEGKWDQLKY
jgi:L-methionine (R)-S-oxide reductase